MKKLLILTLLVLLGIVKKGQAQSDTVLANADSTITIIGKVVDKETNEEIPFANIVFYSGEKQLRYIQSDFDGTFRAEIDTTEISGTLSLQISYTGYSRFQKNNISLKPQELQLSLKTDEDWYYPCWYYPSIVNISSTTTGATYTSDDIMNGAW